MPPDARTTAHRAFLSTFGFTARDWRRIKAHALSITEHHMPAALDDLDAPWRVGLAFLGGRPGSRAR